MSKAYTNQLIPYMHESSMEASGLFKIWLGKGGQLRGSGRQGGPGCFMSAHGGGLIHIKLFKPIK